MDTEMNVDTRGVTPKVDTPNKDSPSSITCFMEEPRGLSFDNFELPKNASFNNLEALATMEEEPAEQAKDEDVTSDDDSDGEEEDVGPSADLVAKVLAAVKGGEIPELWALSSKDHAAELILGCAGSLRIVIDACSPAPSPAHESATRRIFAMETLANLAVPAQSRTALVRAGAPALIARALRDSAATGTDYDERAHALRRHAVSAALLLASTSSLVDDLCFAGVLSAAQDAADAVNDPKTANRLERLENRLGCGGMPDDSDESEEDDETDVAPLIEQVALALDGANLTQLWELSTIPRAAEEIVASEGGLRLVVDACSRAPIPASAEGVSRRCFAMETLANLANVAHCRAALVDAGAPALVALALRDSVRAPGAAAASAQMDSDHALALRRYAVSTALLLASTPSLADALCFAGVLAAAQEVSCVENDTKTANRLAALETRLGGSAPSGPEEDSDAPPSLIARVHAAIRLARLTELHELSTSACAAEVIVATRGGLRLVVDACASPVSPARAAVLRRVLAMETLANLTVHARLRARIVEAGALSRVARALRDSARCCSGDDADDASVLRRHAASAALLLSGSPSLADALCFAGVLSAAQEAANANDDIKTARRLSLLETRLSGSAPEEVDDDASSAVPPSLVAKVTTAVANVDLAALCELSSAAAETIVASRGGLRFVIDACASAVSPASAAAMRRVVALETLANLAVPAHCRSVLVAAGAPTMIARALRDSLADVQLRASSVAAALLLASTPSLGDALCFAGVLAAAQEVASAENDTKTANRLSALETRLTGSAPEDASESAPPSLVTSVAAAVANANVFFLRDLSSMPHAADTVAASAGGLRLVVDACSPAPSPSAAGAWRRCAAMEALSNLAVAAHVRAALVRAGAPALVARALSDSMDGDLVLRGHAVAAALLLASSPSLADALSDVLSAAQEVASADNDTKTASRLALLEIRLTGSAPEDASDLASPSLVANVDSAVSRVLIPELRDLSSMPHGAETIVASRGGLRLVVDACSPAPSPAAEGASRRVIAMETLANLAVPTHLRLALVQGGAPLLISRALRDSMQRGMDDDHALALRRHAVAAALLLASSPSLADVLCFSGVLSAAQEVASAENDTKTANRLAVLETRLTGSAPDDASDSAPPSLIASVTAAVVSANVTELRDLSTMPHGAEVLVASRGGLRLVVDACSPAPSPAPAGAWRRCVAMEALSNLAVPAHVRLALVRAGAPTLIARALRDSVRLAMDYDVALVLRRHAVAAALLLASSPRFGGDLCFAGVLSAAQEAACAMNDVKTASRLALLETRLSGSAADEDDDSPPPSLVADVGAAVRAAKLTELWELSSVPLGAEAIIASAGGLRLVIDACAPAVSPAAEGASRRALAMETLANLAMPAHLRAALVQSGAPALIARALRDSVALADPDGALALRRHAVAAALLLASSPSLAHQLCFAGVLATARDALSAENNDPKTADRLKLLEKRLGC